MQFAAICAESFKDAQENRPYEGIKAYAMPPKSRDVRVQQNPKPLVDTWYRYQDTMLPNAGGLTAEVETENGDFFKNIERTYDPLSRVDFLPELKADYQNLKETQAMHARKVEELSKELGIGKNKSVEPLEKTGPVL